MILIRGAPGSGKHYLADLIINKESEMNDRCRILTFRNYFANNKYDPSQVDRYDNDQFNECRDIIREGFIDFLVVVLNGCGIKQFNKISHMAQNNKGFVCYSIEIHQKPEICQKYDTLHTSIINIRIANEDLLRFSTPIKTMLIDPTPLYGPKESEQTTPIQEQFDRTQPPPFEKKSMQFHQPPFNTSLHQPPINTNLPPPSITSVSSTSNPQSTDDFAKKMAQILQDQNVLQLLQAHMNNSQPAANNVQSINPITNQNQKFADCRPPPQISFNKPPQDTKVK